MERFDRFAKSDRRHEMHKSGADGMQKRVANGCLSHVDPEGRRSHLSADSSTAEEDLVRLQKLPHTNVENFDRLHNGLTEMELHFSGALSRFSADTAGKFDSTVLGPQSSGPLPHLCRQRLQGGVGVS